MLTSLVGGLGDMPVEAVWHGFSVSVHITMLTYGAIERDESPVQRIIDTDVEEQKLAE